MPVVNKPRRLAARLGAQHVLTTLAGLDQVHDLQALQNQIIGNETAMAVLRLAFCTQHRSRRARGQAQKLADRLLKNFRVHVIGETTPSRFQRDVRRIEAHRPLAAQVTTGPMVDKVRLSTGLAQSFFVELRVARRMWLRAHIDQRGDFRVGKHPDQFFNRARTVTDTPDGKRVAHG